MKNERVISLEEKIKQQENIIYTHEAFFEANPKNKKIYEEWVQKEMEKRSKE